jgi:hypothetical protein
MRSSMVLGVLLCAACSSGKHPLKVQAERPDAATHTGGGYALSDAAVGDGGSTPSGSTGSGGPKAGCARSGECEEHIPVSSAAHAIGPIAYLDRPPVGGPHNGCWTTYGVHDKPVPPENWVHNLEHGGVVLLYNCDGGCDSDVGRMEGFVAEHERTVLTEYTEMDARFAIVAWEYRLLLDDALDLDAFDAFYKEHFDHGLEHIAKDGADCGPL